MRQLRAGGGEKSKNDDEPEHQETFEQAVAPHRAQRRTADLAQHLATNGQQPAEERHQHEGSNDEVVVPLAAMPLEGIGITIDVVLEVEATEESIALVEEDGDMPGHDDGQEKQPAGPEEDGAQPGPPGAGRDEEQAADDERKEDGNRSLGQKAETQHGIGVEQQAAGRLAIAVGTEDIVDAEHRQRDEQVEQCIGNRCLGDEADGQRQPHDQGRHLRRPSVGMAQAETVEGQHPEYGKDDGRQAEADFADAEEADRGGLRPVDEDRLVVARRIVQGRRHQVAARHHLARRFRKGALVDVGQRQAPGIEHEGDRHDQQQADGRQEEALDGDGQAGG